MKRLNIMHITGWIVVAILTVLCVVNIVEGKYLFAVNNIIMGISLAYILNIAKRMNDRLFRKAIAIHKIGMREKPESIEDCYQEKQPQTEPTSEQSVILKKMDTIVDVIKSHKENKLRDAKELREMHSDYMKKVDDIKNPPHPYPSELT